MEMELVTIPRSERASFPSLRELVVTDIDANPLAADVELMKRIQGQAGRTLIGNFI